MKSDAAGRDFEARKRASVLQVLFKAARLANEESLRRVRTAVKDDRVRVAHTALFPHVPFEGVRLTALAARVGITKQAVKELVDELEAIGVLERAPDPADGRAKLIRWTAAGREGLARGLEILDALAAELAVCVGPEELARTHRTLLAISDHLEGRGG